MSQRYFSNSKSFSEIIDKYLFALRTRSPLTINLATDLINALSIATLDEIQQQYNRMSSDELWQPSVTNMFNRELQNRATEEAGFIISVHGDVWNGVWNSSVRGTNNKKAFIEVGFEEDITSPPVQFNHDVYSGMLYEPIRKRIVQILLSGKDLSVTIETIEMADGGLSLQLVGLEDTSFIDMPKYVDGVEVAETIPSYTQHWPGSEIMTLPVTVTEDDEFGLIRRMIAGLSGPTDSEESGPPNSNE